MFQTYNREGIKTGEAYKGTEATDKAGSGQGGVMCPVSQRSTGFQHYDRTGTAGKTLAQVKALAEAEAVKKREPESKAKPEQTPQERITDKIILHEAGELNEAETVALFQELVDSGLAWHLQGSYPGMAKAFIDSGKVKPSQAEHMDSLAFLR